MVLHADLSRRAGIHVEWEHIHKLPYLSALTRELEQPSKVLDQFLAPFVQAGARLLTETAQRLAQNLGLGPPAERPAVAAQPVPAAERGLVEPDAPRPPPGPCP